MRVFCHCLSLLLSFGRSHPFSGSVSFWSHSFQHKGRSAIDLKHFVLDFGTAMSLSSVRRYICDAVGCRDIRQMMLNDDDEVYS